MAHFTAHPICPVLTSVQKRLICDIPEVWHALCKSPGIANGTSGGAFQGVDKMILNLSSLQQIAVSILGTLAATSLFVSAAVGPAAQFI
jgi:hypothetical protein